MACSIHWQPHVLSEVRLLERYQAGQYRVSVEMDWCGLIKLKTTVCA
jgi:hypothetical protein